MRTNSIYPRYSNHINCHIVLDILIYFHSPSPFQSINQSFYLVQDYMVSFLYVNKTIKKNPICSMSPYYLLYRGSFHCRYNHKTNVFPQLSCTALLLAKHFNCFLFDCFECSQVLVGILLSNENVVCQ